MVQGLDLKAWKYVDDAVERFGPMYEESPEAIRIPGARALDVHSELMLIAGAIQYVGGIPRNDGRSLN